MALAIRTLGGTYTTSAIEDDSVTATQVNAVTGSATIYGVQVVNGSGAIVYLKIWDATSVTVGTTVAEHGIGCKANSTFSIVWPRGLAHTTGISYACVTGALDTSS